MNIIVNDLTAKHNACTEGIEWLREQVGDVLEVSEKKFRWVTEQEGFDPDWMDWLASVLLRGRKLRDFIREVDDKQISYYENPGDFAEMFARYLLATEPAPEPVPEPAPLTPAEEEREFDEAFEEKLIDLVAILLRQGVQKDSILLGLKLMGRG